MLRPSRGPRLVDLTLDAAQRCPYCHDALQSHEPLLACPECRAVGHRECLADGYCVTFGCSLARPSPRQVVSKRRLLRRVGAAAAALVLLGGGAAFWAATLPVCTLTETLPPAPLLGEVFVPLPEPPPRPVTRRLVPGVAGADGLVTLEGQLEGAAPFAVSVRTPAGQSFAWTVDEEGPLRMTFTLPPGTPVDRVRVCVRNAWDEQIAPSLSVRPSGYRGWTQ